jgi:acetyltransferase
MKDPRNSHESQRNLTALFEPASVAVVGSFKETWFGGHIVVSQLRDFGFPGRVYPINPNYDEALGMKVYPSLLDLPEAPDLVITVTAARTLPGIVRQCAEKGVRAAVVVSDGFAERDAEGARLQGEIVTIAKAADLRLLGPNTIGVVNSANGLLTTPYMMEYGEFERGGIALCSQTGILGPQAVAFGDMKYPLSILCDFGNKCDVNELDMLEYLGKDPKTSVIAMHLEDIKDGPAFLAKAEEVTREKPVLILKPGKTPESAEAILSHTGSLAGEDRVYDAALKQAGVLRVETLRELIEFPKVFACQDCLPSGNRIAFLTLSGGIGAIGIDVAAECGLTLAKLSPETAAKCSEASITLGTNPADFGPAIPVASDLASLYFETAETILKDDNVDCAALVMYGGLRLLPMEFFADLRRKISKPVTMWLYGQRLAALTEWAADLDRIGLPVYSEWETAVKALGAAFQYAQIKAKAS